MAMVSAGAEAVRGCSRRTNPGRLPTLRRPLCDGVHWPTLKEDFRPRQRCFLDASP